MSVLNRLCLDTNVYIIGIQDIDSPEAEILKAIGYYHNSRTQLNVEIILSEEIVDQIRRVGKYLWGKDKVGLVISLIWSRLNFHYVNYSIEWHQEIDLLLANSQIPNEDIEVYVTAKFGNADCFVSANRGLVKAIAAFECLTPIEFIDKYLNPNQRV